MSWARAIPTALRMATQKPLVSKALRAVQPLVPRTKAEWALRFGPELAYAGFAAGQAPEGTSIGDRALIGLEDAGIGLGASLLGQTAGLGIGRKIINNRRLAGKVLNTQQAQDLLGQAITFGDMGFQLPINMLAPRPMFEGAVKKAYGSQDEQMAALAQLQNREQVEAVIAALLAAGVIGTPAAGPALRSKVLDPLATTLAQAAR